jgi:mannose-6-phosphate isomerase-like protein (cupin superfamily)
MRHALLFSFIAALAFTPAQTAAQAPAAPAGRATQAPAKPPQPQPQAQPQQKPPAPAPRRAAQPAAAGRAGIAILVTDPRGVTIGDVAVELTGSATRSGTTNASGQINFTGLQAGTFRILFTGEDVIAFEREVTLKSGATLQLDVTLKPAPPPREIIKEVAAPPPPAPNQEVGPAGQPQVMSLVDLAEKELERKQPRRESLVSCSGNTRATLLQLNQDQPDRLYDEAESLFYVVAGEGFLRIDGKETRLNAGGFASVPRATSFTLGRRGRNPLILLSVLSGEPCEEAR